jgi:hypothetical protein
MFIISLVSAVDYNYSDSFNQTSITTNINYSSGGTANIVVQDLITEIKQNADYVANFISPTNHQMGLFLFWTLIVLVIIYILFHDKINGVYMKKEWK